MEAWYLQCLKQWIDRMGRPPWIPEFSTWLGKSNTAVHAALRKLEMKGWVTRCGDDPGRKEDRRFVPVPEAA